MNKFQSLAISILVWMVCLSGGHTIHAQERITFVGETCKINIPDLHQQQPFTFRLRVLTREGWLDKGKQTLLVDASNKLQFTPDMQGIFEFTTISNKPVTVRLLAMDLPPVMDRDALLKALPQHGQRLLDGKPITILAMGDSVTATGIYHQLLGKMLHKATGNNQITIAVKAHPGKSVDASVRTYETDIKPVKPDIGLLMYGLNDQGAGGAIDVYLKQTRWLCEQLKADFDTDMLLLQPTPHIESEQTAFRTIAYAQALSALADEMALPVAPTFDAIWGTGGKSIAQCMSNMQPLYPPHYSKQWQTMLQKDGKGDTIHPNILGHLALAQAVYNKIAGQHNPPKPLQYKSQNTWNENNLVTNVTITNSSNTHRSGNLSVYRADNWIAPLADSLIYDLASGESQTLSIVWPTIKTQQDLLTLRTSGYVTHDQPYLAITDTCNGHLTVQAIESQRSGQMHYPPQRIVTDNRSFHVQMREGFSRIIQTFTLPGNQPVGLFTAKAQRRNKSAIAQVRYTQFAQALTGKATVDGDLSEWTQHTWSPLGDPSQARWTSGSADNRNSPSECDPSFTFKCSSDGLYMAIKVKGDLSKDHLTVFFDPRPGHELGKVGGYYWFNAGFSNGKFQVRRGETSPGNVRITSAIQTHDDQTHIEMFIPYAMMDHSHWPTDQDMGLSLWWSHNGSLGQTNLLWSDRGHPWNTTHFGVLRRVESPDKILPTLVHIWP